MRLLLFSGTMIWKKESAYHISPGNKNPIKKQKNFFSNFCKNCWPYESNKSSIYSWILKCRAATMYLHINNARTKESVEIYTHKYYLIESSVSNRLKKQIETNTNDLISPVISTEILSFLFFFSFLFSSLNKWDYVRMDEITIY